ncbi:DUF2958 domain-containing protein [Burkholderia cenocepacia]|nr:DUF2958 domain-containing protein [Burkholderia cenocepacia]
MATVRGRLGSPIERDLHFHAEKRLGIYARDARRAGQIVIVRASTGIDVLRPSFH